MRVIGTVLAAITALIGVAAVAAFITVQFYSRDLPDHEKLATYEPPLATRVYAGDGRLLAEYATEKRAFVPIDMMPSALISAFVSAEDKNFFTHPGIDVIGIGRAALTNLTNLGTDRRPVGASTITQQVAKNFLLTNEVSLQRKIREAILAFRISNAFTKERILELYLNQIYLGRGAYGVAAAAVVYFDKGLNELTLSESAFLAALPKAPNNYDPERNPEAAHTRRDWVLRRMLEDGAISSAEAERAAAQPIAVGSRRETETVRADFFAEEVRREIVQRYRDQGLYEGGLVVHSTIDPRLQAIADRTLRAGLETYDRRHGWRGPVGRLAGDARIPWQQRLAAVAPPPGLGAHELAAVLKVDTKAAQIGLKSGETGTISFELMSWARPAIGELRVGEAPRNAGQVVKVNDVVVVERVGKGFALRQLPLIDGALVALDPHTGRVLAMAGGYDYARSEFNRATQALRQPGSAFKPIVYLAALEAGFTPASIVLDAPITFSQGPGLPPWSPSNYAERFYGPTTLRVGIEQSRNVMTVRLANSIGMQRVADAARRLGVFDDMPQHLANALGAGETTLLRMTAAYGSLVNGGYGLQPSLIDRIQDRYGRTVFRHDPRPCPTCRAFEWANQAVPTIEDQRPAVTDPHSAYQIVSMLEGVVQRGTGKAVKAVDKPIAGKTGTSNDSKDTWFVGFAPDLVVGVFVGFDEPKSLGSRETGGAVAAPIFRDFMAEALANAPATPFRIPPGILLVRVDAQTGHAADTSGEHIILEAFKPGTEPGATADGRDTEKSTGGDAALPRGGTGGLY
jgi:penicillin-binding protein 1A